MLKQLQLAQKQAHERTLRAQHGVHCLPEEGVRDAGCWREAYGHSEARRSRENKRAQLGNPPVRQPGRRAKLDQTMYQIITWATEERRSATALVAVNFNVTVSETTVRAVLNARKVRLWWHSSPSAKV